MGLKHKGNLLLCGVHFRNLKVLGFDKDGVFDPDGNYVIQVETRGIGGVIDVQVPSNSIGLMQVGVVDGIILGIVSDSI